MQGFVVQVAGSDLSREASVIAGVHEQTRIPDPKDSDLAGLQSAAEAPGLADNLV
jgi:hypothetical protein